MTWTAAVTLKAVSAPPPRRAALLTLGCARNEVDSEELAGRLTDGGWELTDGADGTADVIVVNTCGFVESAKKDSVDALLEAAETGTKVVAVGCMAERYGAELAESLPEAAAVLGFDHYPDLGERLDDVVAGRAVPAHRPADRRTLLPITPVQRQTAKVVVPGHATVDEHTPAHLRTVLRRRLDSGPVASLKLASGCDRRCAFCAIPSFRGSFVSRHPEELLAEAEWLAKTQLALVHGDYSPKNLLVSADRLVVLDAECGWFGDPAFDTAFLLTHLHLKALLHARNPAPLLALIPAFWSAYRIAAGPHVDAALEQRSVRLLLCLLLARVYGKSPVEYLGTPVQRDFITDFVLDRLRTRPVDLSSFTASWRAGLATL